MEGATSKESHKVHQAPFITTSETISAEYRFMMKEYSLRDFYQTSRKQDTSNNDEVLSVMLQDQTRQFE